MAIHKVFVSNSPNPPKIKSSSSKANVKKAIGLITSKTQYYFINFQMSKKQGLFFFLAKEFQVFINFQKLNSK